MRKSWAKRVIVCGADSRRMRCGSSAPSGELEAGARRTPDAGGLVPERLERQLEDLIQVAVEHRPRPGRDVRERLPLERLDRGRLRRYPLSRAVQAGTPRA